MRTLIFAILWAACWPAIASSQAFNTAILASRPKPAWVDSQAQWQVNALAGDNRVWLGDGEFGSLAAAVTAGRASFVRPSAKYAESVAGVYASFPADTLAMTDKGVSIEGIAVQRGGYSLDTSNAVWIVARGTKTSGQTDSFSGTNAALFSADGTSGGHILASPAGSATSGLNYLVSVFVKKGTAQYVQFAGNSAIFGSNAYINLDLTNHMVVAAGSAVTASGIMSIDGTWYRAWFIAPATTTVTTNVARFAPLITGAETYTPSNSSAGTLNVVMLNAIEGATALSSPILTTTPSSATRAADVLIIRAVPGVYNIRLTLADGTTQTITGVTIGSAGYTVPSNGKLITKIVAMAAP